MKIIIAIDDSPFSERLLETVVRRHWAPDTQFKLLNVVEPFCVDEDEEREYNTIFNEVFVRRKEHAATMCAEARKRLETHIEQCHVHYDIRQGDPKQQIIQAAIDWDADRILIGAHGREICPHNLLGSVSRSVASHAPCTVEIVRPKVTRREEKVASSLCRQV